MGARRAEETYYFQIVTSHRARPERARTPCRCFKVTAKGATRRRNEHIRQRWRVGKAEDANPNRDRNWTSCGWRVVRGQRKPRDRRKQTKIYSRSACAFGLEALGHVLVVCSGAGRGARTLSGCFISMAVAANAAARRSNQHMRRRGG